MSRPLATVPAVRIQRITDTCEVVLRRGRMKAALGVEDVLTPGLVEADRDVMRRLAQGPGTGSAETPGTQEAWAARHRECVITNVPRAGPPRPSGRRNRWTSCPSATRRRVRSRCTSRSRRGPAERFRSRMQSSSLGPRLANPYEPGVFDCGDDNSTISGGCRDAATHCSSCAAAAPGTRARSAADRARPHRSRSTSTAAAPGPSPATSRQVHGCRPRRCRSIR